MSFSGGSSTGGFGNGITFTVALRGAREVATQADVAAKGIERTGTSAKKAGEHSKAAAGGFTLFGKSIGFSKEKAEGGIFSFKRLRSSVLGFTGAFVGYEAVKGSIETNEQLVTSSQKLKSGFDLTTKSALTWAAVSKVLNIEPRSLTMGFTQLSRAMTTAREGNDEMIGSFHALGISTDYINAHANDLDGMMRLVVKRLGEVKDGSIRAYVGQKTLGRGFQTLLPLMMENGEVFDRISKTLDQFFTGRHLDDAEKFRAAMVDYKVSSLELQVALGESLEPALIKMTGAMSKFVADGQRGKGVAGVLVDVYHELGHVLDVTFGFLSKHKTATKALTYVLVGLWATTKLVNAGFALWEVGAPLAKGVLMGVRFLRFEWLALSLAMDANPIGLIIVGAFALGFAIGALVAHFGGWHKVMKGIWGWIKHEWPLLAGIILLPIIGPWGLAAAFIIMNWGKIKHFFAGIPGFLNGVGADIESALKAPFGAAYDWIQRKWDGLPGPLKDALNTGLDVASGNFNVPYIPGLATGGTVMGNGSWITGESGPELNTFTGSKVRVQPLTGNTAVQPLDWQKVNENSADGREIVLKVPVHLDRKKVGEVMTSYMKDTRARR